jgi:Domain of unknown function (DUF4386)
MHPTDKAARVAGAVYLSLVATGPFTLLYVPNKLIVPGNATATGSNILAHEMLFRVAIVADLIGAVIFICLAVALYRLLNGVNKTQASLMVAFVLVSAAVAFVNVLNNIAALMLFRGSDFLGVLDKPQRDALGMLFVRLHGQGNVINEMFWGLWLLPLAWLVYKSRFLPRFLGVWLALGGFAYVILCVTSILAPQYQGRLFSFFQPAFFGELAFMLWLLVKGAKVRPLAVAAA